MAVGIGYTRVQFKVKRYYHVKRSNDEYAIDQFNDRIEELIRNLKIRDKG